MSQHTPSDLKGEAHVGDWWSFMGYACTSRGGLSYSCPTLKLHGFPSDLQLHRAIKREVAKRVKNEKRAPCGCIVSCPLHAHAEELLRVLVAAVQIAPSDMLSTVWGAEASTAIRQAKGDTNG